VAVLDPWNPTAAELAAMTPQEKEILIDRVVKYATSDSQFALRLGRTIRLLVGILSL